MAGIPILPFNGVPGWWSGWYFFVCYAPAAGSAPPASSSGTSGSTSFEYGGVLIAGVTPFPYKVITILSGATGLSLAVFMVASLIARSLRLFLVAFLLWKSSNPILDFIERQLGLVFTVFVVQREDKKQQRQ